MEKQEEVKEDSVANPRKLFFWEVFLFSLTLALGIITAFRLNQIWQIEKVTLTPISSLQFILYFLFATIFILLLLSLKKFQREKGFVFKLVFVFLTFFGGAITFSSLLPHELDILAFVFLAILIWSWLRFSSIFIHDFAIMLSITGISSSLGLRLSPWTVVFFLVIFSLYDFIAVYKTKHMIKMAKEMIAVGAPLALICPQRISDFRSSLKEVKPGGRFLILGGGDIAFPLVLAASLIPQGIFHSSIVALFALLGLAFSFFIFVGQKVRRPIPALPPIALFSILGFLLTRLI